jgi:23S rRNA (cytidine2498-2'-O)-methyltransferase
VSVFLCSTGFETALMEEAGGSATMICPGVVMAEADGDFVFARQILPDAQRVRAPSISKLADAALAAIRMDRPYRLDALVADDPADPNLPGELARRVGLVGDTMRERLRRRKQGDELLVQLLLTSRDELFVSAAQPVLLPPRSRWPALWPGGRVPVADDWAAPSSAFRKLEEALTWLGTQPQPGDRCVDLGAAPGGWSHVALGRGASVTAVDRAELDPRIAKRVRHVRRDGFSYVPEDPPVDWLLCDIIAAPEKSFLLLERWLASGWTRNLVFHLKFKGRRHYALAQSARALAPALRVKHLFYDRNEVTVMGRDLCQGRAPLRLPRRWAHDPGTS